MVSTAMLSPRARNMMQCAPVYLLMLISTLINLMTTVAAPVDKKVSDTVKEGPYNLTVQSGVAGAILIICGLLLCFFGYRLFHVTMFLIGFYFFGNITYIGMANGGVTSETLLLVVSIVVGIIGGLLLICCSRLGVAILGALALYALGLWILSLKSGGLITSHAGRGIFLGILVVVGFFLGCFREREVVIIGSALVGAFSFVIGVDFFAHTGFVNAADSFINSKAPIDNRLGGISGKQWALVATFIVMAILGMVVQFYAWGRRPFYPTNSRRGINGSNVVYTEKPSRFGGWFSRGRY